MKLAYETEYGSIYQGDCLSWLRSPWINDQVVIFTDPPYGHGKNIVTSIGGKWKHYKPAYKKVDWNEKPGQEYFRLMKQWPYFCFGGNYLLKELIGGEPFETPDVEGMKEFVERNKKGWLIWDKLKPPTLSFSKFEMIYSSNNIETKIVPVMWNGLAKEDPIAWRREKVFHPCQKSVMLLMGIIKDYIPENVLIVDPFAGSCSLAVACEKLKRRYVCIEKNPDYVQGGVEWAREYLQNGRLF